MDDPFSFFSTKSRVMFEVAVGIDGDLALVADYDRVHIFCCQSNHEWVKIGSVDFEPCYSRTS